MKVSFEATVYRSSEALIKVVFEASFDISFKCKNFATSLYFFFHILWNVFMILQENGTTIYFYLHSSTKKPCSKHSEEIKKLMILRQ